MLDQIHMLSPVDGARNINVAKPITVVIDQVIDLSHLRKGDISLVSDDGKSLINGQLTANDLAYTFKPDTPLLPKTRYRLKINANLIAKQPTTAQVFVTAGIFTTADPTQTMIFTTDSKNPYPGNLLAAYPTESNGTAAADRICNTSAQRPDTSRNYKPKN